MYKKEQQYLKDKQPLLFIMWLIEKCGFHYLAHIDAKKGKGLASITIINGARDQKAPCVFRPRERKVRQLSLTESTQGR